MKYISTKEAAAIWNIGERRVQFYCANEKIPGAKRVGNQWIIPQDAQRPVDGRTREAREQNAEVHPYRFPLLIYSPAYNEMDRLSTDERALMNAQVLHLQGSYAECVKVCRVIWNNSSDRNVLFGAYITAGYSFIVLGLGGEYNHVLEEAERIANEETEHHEDYRLMLTALTYHTTWDTEAFARFDVNQLSDEALCFYNYQLLFSTSFAGTEVSRNTLTSYQIFSRIIDAQGIRPLSIVVHFSLAIICVGRKEIEASERYIDLACDSALAFGWYELIAKHYHFSPATMDKFLEQRKPRSSAFIRGMADRAIASWRLINSMKNGQDLLRDVGVSETEVLHLIVFGLSNREIGSVLGISTGDVGSILRTLCHRLKLENRRDLKEHARKLFSQTQDT